jgi:hypothetical protein
MSKPHQRLPSIWYGRKEMLVSYINIAEGQKVRLEAKYMYLD